tara:strand:+ start:1330 stop:2118 length:789 start_codon:yes stop_codon:yes gene_type:complete
MGRISLIKFNTDQTEKYRYVLNNFKSLSYDISTPATPAPMPEENSAENILVKIEGNSSNLKISWTIKNETENQEVRKFPSGYQSQTIKEQLYFFQEEFVPVSIEDSYKLVIDFNPPADKKVDSEDSLIIKGTISKAHFTMTGSAPATFNASVDFLQGNVFAIYETDTAGAPENVTVAQGSTSQFVSTWDEPLSAGDFPITEYLLEYKLVGSSTWSNVTHTKTGTSESKTVTILVGGTYDVRISAKTKLGYGIESKTVTQVLV